MSGAEYGGDEVGAIVLDIGSYTTRVGYAGEDMPLADFPTLVGIAPDNSEEESMEVAEQTSSSLLSKEATTSATNKLDYVVGTQYVTVKREGLELYSPLKDGLIEKWDLFEHLLNYIYNKLIRSEKEYHPLLMSEPSWNTKSKRMQLTELMFEKYDVPAFFLAKGAVLSTFANARSTALVVDSGHTQTSVVPVHDGYALTQAIVRTPYGGRFVTQNAGKMLEKEGIELIPANQLESKQAVKEKMKPIYTLKKCPPLTGTYREFMADQLITDFKVNIGQVSEDQYSEEELNTLPALEYEFTHGYTHNFSWERFAICEQMFSRIKEPAPNPEQDLNTLIQDAVVSAANACDPDLRGTLYCNMIVVGGNSLLKGFSDRLLSEVKNKIPTNMRVNKNVSNNTAVERRFGTWIGGSILASLGTFQQIWISKAEYDEQGKICIEKKCP